MTWGGLSIVCCKLESAESETNEILEINVLQKLIPHALCGANCNINVFFHFVSEVELIS